MRKLTCFVLAAALASAPALAQNETTPANMADANATMADNTVMAGNETMAGNEMMAAPAPATTETTPPAPAPRKSSGGFPWGAIGLVGLIGLLGRKRRD